MPDPNTEHGLRVQLATALRETERLRDALGDAFEDRRAADRRADAAEAALAAARRECEASKADLTMLLEFVRYVICPVCAADHVRIENGIVRGHPPLDRRAAGEGNRCTASRGSLLDVVRDAHARATPQWSAKPRDDPNAHNEVFQQIKAALAAPAAGEEGETLMRALRDSVTVSTMPPTSKP